MATFNYETYKAQQQTRTTQNSGTGDERVEIHFLNEYLKNDGDTVIIRFPYTGMHELVYNSTHLMPFPGRQYPGRVHCEAENCPLCANGVKQDIRVFLKALAYVPNNQNIIEIKNSIWDRPAAFADIDLKNLIVDYGDISQILFKLRRNGKGTATRYSLTPIVNSAMYNPEIYKADFTELNKVDPGIMLAKTLDQYNKITNPAAASTPATSNTFANQIPTTVNNGAQNQNSVMYSNHETIQTTTQNPNIDQNSYTPNTQVPSEPTFNKANVEYNVEPTMQPSTQTESSADPNGRQPRRYIF